MPGELSPNPEDARALLEEVGRVRRTTRRRVGRFSWIAFMVWAIVFAGAALVGGAAPWYWLAAVPGALIVTGVVEHRLTDQRPVRRSEYRYWLIGASITILCPVGAYFLSPASAAGWVWLVLGVGFAGFALLEYQMETAAVMVLLAAVALLVSATVTSPEAVYRGLGALFAGGMGWSAWRMK